MRFSYRITFVKEGESYYDPVQGGYGEGTPIKDIKPCKLSAMGLDRTNEIFGSMEKKITIARLQQPYTKDFDHILINTGPYKGKYTSKRQSDYRKGVFYLESIV